MTKIKLQKPLSLTYISLLIIPYMIVYVTNKQEPWTLNLEVKANQVKRHKYVIQFIIYNVS